MKIVPSDLEIEITDQSQTEELEIEVDYRCFVTENKAFAPMTIGCTIHDGLTLQECIKEGKKRYESDYLKVEIMQVRVGDFI
tara:strand:- start:599 stop:844 length:246 start_codon:yes stop_codon:yes gene_type:complete